MGLAESIVVRVGADITAYRAKMGAVLATTRSTSAKLATSFSRIRRGATQASAAIAAAGGVAIASTVKAATSFSKNLRLIQTLIDVDEDGLRSLGELSKNMAESFGTSALGNLKALYDGISAGVVTTANATEFLTAANKATVAGNSNVATTTEALIRLMKAYGPEVVSATKASDILFATIKKGVTTMDQLAPSVGRAAGVFAAANVPIEQLSAAIATATGTASTAEAIVQVSQLIASIIKPAEDATEEALRLGLGFNAATLASEGLDGVLSSLRDKIGSDVAKAMNQAIINGEDLVTVQERMARQTGLTTESVAKLFSSIRALRGVLALLSKDGKTFDENLAQAKDSAGLTTEAFNTMSKEAAIAFGQIKAAIVNTAIEIGEALTPNVLELGSSLRSVGKDITAWIKANPELTAQIAKWAVAITSIAVVLLPVSLAVGALTGLLTALAGVFGLLVTLGGAVIGVIAAIGAPVAILVAGLAAAVVGLVVLWDDFLELFAEIGEDIKSVWVGIGASFFRLLGKISDFWKKFSKQFVDAISQVGATITKLWEDAWGGVSDFFGGILVDIGGLWVGALDSIVDAWDFVSGGIVSAWRATWNAVADFFDSVITGIRNAWQSAVDFILGLWQSISGFFETVGDFFVSIGEGVVQFLGLHEGGFVGGPAGIDRVPAMLTAGEFVVNSQAAQDFGPLLQAINNGDRGRGEGGNSFSFSGGMTVSLPNVRNVDRAGIRILSEELNRLDARRLRATNRRTSR